MKKNILLAMLLTVIPMTSLISLTSVASAQQNPEHQSARPTLAIDYTWIRANAPPGDCQCFHPQGGSATLTLPMAHSHQWNYAFDVTAAHAGNVNNSGYDLNLTTFTAGVQWSQPLHNSAWQPSAHALIGAAHNTGSLLEGNTPASSDSALTFAWNLGAAFDRKLNRKFALRIFEADYLYTTQSNRGTDRQNNLRLSAGLVWHFH